MKDLRILMALTKNDDTKIEDFIVELGKNYDLNITYSKEFYNLGVISALGENKWDALILNANLENEIFDIAQLDKITDNYSNLNIILVLEDKLKGSDYVKSLYSYSCYNAIFKEDLDVQTIVELILEGRTKRDVKIYYGIDEEISDSIIKTNYNILTEEKSNKIIERLRNSSLEDIEKEFKILEKEYSETEISYVLSKIFILEEDSLGKKIKEGYDIAKYKDLIDIKTQEIETKERVVVKEVLKEVIKKEVVEKNIFSSPSDYKKVIGVFNTYPSSGVTSIIQELSYYFSEKNKRVAILDFSNSRDLHEKYMFIKEDISYEPLEELVKGVNRPYKENDKLSIYSISYNNNLQISKEEILFALDTVKSQNDIVFVDLKFEEAVELSTYLDHLLLVVTPNVYNTKFVSSKLKSIKDNPSFTNFKDKLVLIINKYIDEKGVLSVKDIMDFNTTMINDYSDTSKNEKLLDIEEKFIINFDNNILLESYTSKRDRVVTDDFICLANHIYKTEIISKKKRIFNFLRKNKGDK